MMSFEKRLGKIEERNKRVEADKAWETSWTRRIFIVAFTYIFIGLFLTSIKVEKPWLNAIIPAAAFILSTLSIPFLKSLWIKYIYKR